MECTKGEWRITRDAKRGFMAVRSVDDSPICFIYSITPNSEANAQLIAAAPDMYEALRAIAEMKVTPISYYELAKNIIAKAEGK